MSEFNKVKWIPSWKLSEEAKAVKKQQVDEENLKNVEKTEENFPPLIAAPTNLRVWGGEKKFSELAKNWDSETQEKMTKEKEMAEFNKSSLAPVRFVMPTFKNSKRFVETTDSVESEEVEQTKVPSDSVWKVVDYSKNRRKERNMEEIANRPPSPEGDGTVWPEKDLNETCWDERR